MARQSDDLAAETAVMRLFDRALQGAADLPHRTHLRVLRYVHDRVSDRLAVPASAGGSSSSGDTVTASGGGLGGNGSPVCVATASGTITGGGGAGNSGSPSGGSTAGSAGR